MTHPAPLPFRIRLPGEDSVSLAEIRDVSRRMDGLLHCDESGIVLEWELTESIDEVSLLSVSSTKNRFEVEVLEVPFELLASAELVGGILRPRLVLRARSLGVFSEIPGAKADRLMLDYARGDRFVAVEMARAITAAIVGLPVTDEQESITPLP
ncbi:MAG: hypothetical protein SFU57_05650 [Gemmatimonadales bacterium]|nr:hypothetical protein [Gemmatimonadales bacterium]